MQSAISIVDGELLRAFAAFAETLNFTAAAKQIGLSQPALHERVARLGERLGVSLYERSGRQLALTRAGEKVAAYARETLAHAARFAGQLQGELHRDRVVLAAGEGSFLYLLGPAIARFHRRDAAELELRTLGAPDACDAVRTGAAHLAVAVVDLVPRDLLAVDLLETPLVVAMKKTHPLAKRRKVSLAALADEPLILPPAGRSHRDFVGRAIARLGRELAAPIEADGWPLILSFAAAGLGLAVVNGCCALPRGVVARPVPELGTVRYRLLRRRGAPPHEARDRLAAVIRDVVA
ncbi:MAG: LysR family transcriptional regulator [Myxococcota bacterium]